ncbi:MAG TPA: nitrous oxide-stimulated promoter family protein [Paludibacteraceae bacterium]|nr:nitrous oxide-stimulated promoter family protein [Paludibacteraceae bacterium]HQF50161.1 nitrous oxide-stimulated promoter family protein [Paludibacteraceae bacterium]
MKDESKIEKKKRVLAFMISFYCKRKHHTQTDLCSECAELQEYAFARLSKCPFGEKKTSCRKCLVHCYKPVMRQRVKDVMRFSGPLMFFVSPVEAFRHVFR